MKWTRHYAQQRLKKHKLELKILLTIDPQTELSRETTSNSAMLVTLGGRRKAMKRPHTADSDIACGSGALWSATHNPLIYGLIGGEISLQVEHM